MVLVFSPFYFQVWIIFTIITVNSFSGRLPISSSFVWCGGFLPCSFICCIFLCVLILFNLLCLGSPFCRIQVRSSHCFCCLPLVGEVGSVACVAVLVERTAVCVLVGGAWILSFWWARLRLVVCFGGVCKLSMILGSLSANGCGHVPILLVVWHGASSTGACCWLGGAGSYR